MKSPLKVAIQAAREAGKLLMASYGRLKISQISAKSKNDFVTEMDKKSERLILKTIQKNFPGSSIHAEESGFHSGNDLEWIIDPLDGTVNYIHQFPMFSVSIGVLEKKRLCAGVIFDPVHQELFTAQKGRGSFLNNKRITVSKTPSIGQALVATGIPFRARGRFDQYMRSFNSISMKSSGMRRGGSAALDLAYVACGRFDGFWELGLSRWDIAAGALLIQEAGGVITDLWGKDQYLTSGDVLASNGFIHPSMRRITSLTIKPRKIITP